MRTSAHPAAGRRRILLIGAVVMAVAVVAVVVFTVFLSDDEAGQPTGTAAAPSVSARSSMTATSATPSSSEGIILPGSSPTDSELVGGQTDHLEFARLVAQSVLAYDSGTDFQARNQDLLRAAAPSPYGDPSQLARDLTAFTPAGPALDSLQANGTTVTVYLTDVTVSEWAANRLKGIGVSPGVYGIDVTGQQTITTKSGNPARVTVQLGVTVACPPATSYCTLDRVLPQHLQDALGPG
ncbi:lipase chaperone [Nakamurella multipartita]|uniref:Uncharacterized protein n=1 Tax=Nakamurella multipartita (strain ATCC 700099 / DSM 44233 / CIP 104796 / JCM 9543 / NBRC 105858 / Y-104) TaxID=479431 RepID=C8XHD4_NAKMY|nr:lipase chaperone [Nakamurella multipartita]ACV78340.1 hypothetical protein Namu_1951 [Nakamurella multipartita DSM 44233]